MAKISSLAPAVAAALRHATTLTRPVPSARWRRTAAALVASAGEAVRTILERFTARRRPLSKDADELLRGLTWMLAGDQTDLLGRVALTAARRRCAPRTAAAAVEALAECGGEASMRVLARLLLTVQHRALLTRTQAALDRVSVAHGWPPDETLEVTVDDHGLDRDGRVAVRSENGNSVVLELVDDKVRVPSGGPPEARVLAKRIRATLTAERRRVEALLSADREWSTADWIARYLAHPVTGSIGRRLVWLVSTDGETWTAGCPERRAGRWVLVDRTGVDVDVGRDGGRIRLWHPVYADVGEVAAWRDRLIDAHLHQPFKQVLREVYRPTPAEEVDPGCSGRFAGHVLRYRQAGALMRARGWQATFLGPWAGGAHSEATKRFGAWRASFGHDLIGEIDQMAHAAQYCSTGRVCFDRIGGATDTLADVPATVFSEVMRDVDLFVGVASATTNTSADRAAGR